MKSLQGLPVAVALAAAVAAIKPATAQDWVPTNGYWEVISTIKKPSEATVKFYDLQGHMVFQERVTGVVLDPRRRKTCRWLNKQLQGALAAWASRK